MSKTNLFDGADFAEKAAPIDYTKDPKFQHFVARFTEIFQEMKKDLATGTETEYEILTNIVRLSKERQQQILDDCFGVDQVEVS